MYGSQISFGPRNFLGHFYQLLRFSMDKATLWEHLNQNIMFLGAVVLKRRLGKERSQKAKSRRIVFTRCSLALRARSRSGRSARSFRQKYH